MVRRQAVIQQSLCVACGACAKVCSLKAVSVWKGLYARVDLQKCVGCGLCAKTCPAEIITIKEAAAP